MENNTTTKSDGSGGNGSDAGGNIATDLTRMSDRKLELKSEGDASMSSDALASMNIHSQLHRERRQKMMPPTSRGAGFEMLFPTSATAVVKNTSGSGSGSENSSGATSSSGNAAAVTASTSNNNTTSSGGSGDDRSSSGSGGGSGSGGNRRSGGEASSEYYYAGYGSGPSTGGTSSNQATSDGAPQGPALQAAGVGMANGNLPTFASFQGAPLAAASAAAAAGPQAQQSRQPGLAPPRNGVANMVVKHVEVAYAEGGLRPPSHAFASHLRHHPRHYHARRSHGRDVASGIDAAGDTDELGATPALPQAPQTNDVAAQRPALGAAFTNDTPSAISGPIAAPLEGSMPQVQSQQYPGSRHAHAQPSPVSRSYGLRLLTSDEQAVLQRLPRTHATVVAHDLPPPPTSSDVWSSTSGSSGSLSPRKRPNIDASANASVTVAGQPMVASVHLAQGGTIDSIQMSDGTPMSSSDGSDGGYVASSERQSGSGSDSISSDDANKKAKATSSARVLPVTAPPKSKVGGTANPRSHFKQTETSSISSSVLADLSSVVIEDESILFNDISRVYSPRSRCTSHSSANGSNVGKKATADVKIELKFSQETASVGKRPVTHLKAPAANARKRLKTEESDGFSRPLTTMKSGPSTTERSAKAKVRLPANHHHHYHSRSKGRKTLKKTFLSAKRGLSTYNEGVASAALALTAFANQGVTFHEGKANGCSQPMTEQDDSAHCQDVPIYSLGQDVMAQIMAFLDPPEVHSFLTTPLSKTWLVTYTASQELWKILCSSKPFLAKLDESVSSDESTCSFPIFNERELRHLFGKYRLLYTSFVRCMKYLDRLQDDATYGRTPSDCTSSSPGEVYPRRKDTSLKSYFAKARTLARSNRRNGGSRSSSDAALSLTTESGSHGSGSKKKRRTGAATGGAGAVASDTGAQNNASQSKLGRSMLTDRLLRPTQAGDVDNVNLPWSCAIYSVVNWMVAFADVEGIQIMCLKCLPYLLEDESQRTTAQRAGLTDSVLRAMVLFSESSELHTVAFHTLVLLARPLGGNEGMLFHSAMVNTRGIFSNGSHSKNGIVIMLDSMRRFAHDEILQAMSCWSLVNVALTPLQKRILVKLGGLTVTSNAMLQHPYNAEVQFRALFALINLVIPTEPRPDETEEMREFEREIFQQLGEAGETSEKEMLDVSVGQIANLVVVAMKNFCSSEAILNRACLVLHNLSLNEAHHSLLLWTPNCYQMLEWCLANYPHDHVLQQSAGGTIQRLNATLSTNEELRARFTLSIRAQQQHSLELARQEAMLIQEQQRQQEELQRQINAS